jgi:LysM repeat protein/uncharacterized protein YcbK (DUF882 family)
MLARSRAAGKKLRAACAERAHLVVRVPPMKRAALAFAIATFAVSPASAQQDHVVRSGQSLARIAQRYHVSVSSLAGANGLARDAQLRPGQVLRVPEQGTHYVAQGETLASIARDHQVSVADLQRSNRSTANGPLRIGQRLVLPGFEASNVRERAEQQWGRPRSPGVATLYRRALDRRFRVRLVDERGRVRRAAVQRLRELMRPRLGRSLGPEPPRRLVEMLARISDHFGGRTITIVSGYRNAGGSTRETSRHTRGHALDLRIQGVPATALRDYVRSTFRNVGVGYYPRSGFVHLDVRDRNTYWVDWSGRGESPRYQRPGQAAPEDASEDEIARTGIGDIDPDEAGEGEAAAEEDDGTGGNPDHAELEVSE